MTGSAIDLPEHDTRLFAKVPPPAVLFPPRGAGAAVPMTCEQRHIWLDIVRGSDSLSYNEPMILGFDSATDPDMIVQAFNALVQRHEALRTSFANLDGAPRQIIRDTIDPFLPMVDLRNLTEPAREPALRAIAEADAAVPFDLDRPPLLRARMIRMGDADHRLALTLHHILFDGRSLIAALMGELPAIHAALVAGRAPSLPPPPAQYGDYAVWQATRRDEAARERALDYWRTALAGGAGRVALPTDRPREPGAAHPAAAEAITLDGATVKSIEMLARARTTSAYAVYVAAFMAQLRRYGGEDDVTIGSVIDTRASIALGGMLGYCLNTVALRSQPTPTMPFDALLDSISDTLFAAYEHAALPFEQVAQMLDGAVPGTEDGRFHVMISMQPAPPPHDETVTLDYLTPPQAKADLYLELEPNDAGLRARLIYDTTLFDAETVRAIAGHWKTLLASIGAAPSTPIGDLAMLPEAEASAIAALGLGACVPIPDATLPELIRATIADRPDAAAVICGASSLTYAELGKHANGVARALIAASVGHGDFVALCVERSPAMVAAILGILETGAAYVPLDPSFPPSRLTAIIADAAPTALVCDAATRALFDTPPCPILSVDAIVPDATAPPPSPATARSLAYVIYTSGSTGVPKGVEIEQRGVINVLQAVRQMTSFSPGDTMLAISRLTFDMSVPDIFLPLVAGGRTAIASSETITDPQLLAAEIARSNATLIEATPATWQSLVTDGWPGKPGLKILCGGEALGRSLADALLARGMRLWNGYGPTETTIYTTFDEVAPQATIAIGRPIDNVGVLILDDRDHAVPCNVAGHLYIAGAGLARCYRDPELTARAFIERDGRRLYRSGDVALRRRDGRIEWLGRSDGQIKIRGFRIDIGDVEAAICTCPGVALAAVTAVGGSAGAAHDLAAYVMPRAGEAAPDFATLRAHLSGKLPRYMIPTRYCVVEQMPVSSSGKINRDALPSIDDPAFCPPPADLPEGEVETRIAAAWCEILGFDAVGATDDFFDLGGHSLLAAKLVGRLSVEFDRRLPLATLMRAPTVRQLAALLTDDEAPVTVPRTIVIGSDVGPALFWIDATPNFRADGFRDLAAALGDDVALIGLPVDTEAFAAMDDVGCVTAIADGMATAILSSGREGPYQIGGWCNGGLLAIAVADRLRARNAEVDTLVMLDATNQARYRNKASRIRREVREFFRAPAGERRAYFDDLIGGYLSRWRRRLLPRADEATALLDLTDRFMRVLRDADLPAYDGRAILIEAEGGGGSSPAEWGSILTGAVAALRTSGGHESVLHPPYVDRLADRIRDQLTGYGVFVSRARARAAASARPTQCSPLKSA